MLKDKKKKQLQQAHCWDSTYYPGCQQYWILKDKNEEAMEYLMAEFDKTEINLDRMLSAQQTGEAQNDQWENEEGETIVAETRDQETEIDDPERIQRMGSPPKPIRMKTHIEEIKKKLVAAEKKKKKKKWHRQCK